MKISEDKEFFAGCKIMILLRGLIMKSFWG